MSKNIKKKQKKDTKPNFSKCKHQNISHNQNKSQSPKFGNQKKLESSLYIACDSAKHFFKSYYLVKSNDKS